MIYDVTVHCPNGVRVSRPIVAESSDAAIKVMAAEHDIEPTDTQFTFVAEERNNPELERMLERS